MMHFNFGYTEKMTRLFGILYSECRNVCGTERCCGIEIIEFIECTRKRSNSIKYCFANSVRGVCAADWDGFHSSTTFEIVERWNINLMRRHRDHNQSWLQWLVRNVQWWWWLRRWSLPVQMFLSVNSHSSVLKRKLNWNEYHKILRCTRQSTGNSPSATHSHTRKHPVGHRIVARCVRTCVLAISLEHCRLYLYKSIYALSLCSPAPRILSPSLTNSPGARKIIECVRLPYNLI